MVVGSMPVLGVVLALLSAAVLAAGNLWQSRGVAIATSRAHGAASMLQLLKTPIWLAGTAFFGIAIVLQMGSLTFAPLILVQPIGVAALVFTALFTSWATGKKPSRGVIVAILITLVGVSAYVVVASIVSVQKPIHDSQLIEMLVTLAAVLLASLLITVIGKKQQRAPILYVVLGGIYSGFVATLGKTVILRVEAMFKGGHFHFGSEGWLTLLCVLGIGIASALSIYYVQFSHTCNSPDVVIAGLTVVDPGVAVVLGITILQEAAGAPMWSTFAFLAAGAVAFVGVYRLAKEEATANAEAAADGAEKAEVKSAVRAQGRDEHVAEAAMRDVTALRELRHVDGDEPRQ